MATNLTIHELVDVNTGESITMTAVAKKKARSPFSSFTMLSLDSIGHMRKALTAKELKPTDIIVLFCMMEHMETENEVDIYTSSIANETGITRENVSRSIKRLLSVSAISKGCKIGNVQTYKISATFAWKGNSDLHRSAIREETDKRVADQIKRDKVKLEVVK